MVGLPPRLIRVFATSTPPEVGGAAKASQSSNSMS